MPTTPAKARHLLEVGKAIVAFHNPFTIRLAVPSGQHVQPVTAGVDLGAKVVGVGAVGNERTLYQGEVTLRACPPPWRLPPTAQNGCTGKVASEYPFYIMSC
jgi:hypothetical protein